MRIYNRHCSIEIKQFRKLTENNIGNITILEIYVDIIVTLTDDQYLIFIRNISK